MKMNLAKRILAAVAVLMWSAVATAAENPSIKLMLDWFVNPNHGPIVIAAQKGYFEQQGIKVEILEPADPSTPAKLVAAGKMDLAVTYQNTLTIDVAEKLPLVRSATLIATPLNTLMVLDNGKIKSLADLKGKTIGIAISGNEEATIGTMLATAGVGYDEVKLVNVGWALSSSLASGRVDAIWGGLRNFETNQLELEGFKAKSFFPEEHGVPSYDELVFVANANNYDADALARFNNAIADATRFIVNHPEQAWQTFISYAPDTLDTELNRRAWEDTLNRFALRPAAADLAAYDAFSEFMHRTGVIKTKPNAADFVLQPQAQ